jgi:drug/metabolite transporter (DMT)-like permease
MPDRKKIIAGVSCGMGAGALWGLVFLAPELVSEFNPLQLTIGRYLFYGVFSVFLIAPLWRRLLPHLGRREWLTLCGLALCGNIVYYLLLSNAVQNGGIAMTSLIVGFLPVTVTTVGSRDHGALPLKRLWPSLLFSTAGVMCIAWQALAPTEYRSIAEQLIGLFCALGALASWTCYAVGNARALVRLHDVSAHEWNLLIGVTTCLQTLVLVPVALVLYQDAHTGAEWAKLAAVSAAVAVGASLLGNALWNRMSKLLPLTMVGQMIVFETMFALTYGFLWEWRLPTPLEVLAFALVIMSVVSCLAAHRKPRLSEDELKNLRAGT